MLVRHRLLASVLCALTFAACDEDTPSPVEDTAEDTADVSLDAAADVGTVDTSADIATDTDDVAADAADAFDAPDVPATAEGTICTACATNEDCGAAGAVCVTLPTGGAFCGWDCLADPSVCPDGTTCFDLGDDGTQAQCLPDDLLCNNPCDEVSCGGGWVCDPTDGSCNPPRELCDQCENNQQCGGEEDLCLTFPDGLRGCATSCAVDACPDGYRCSGITVGTGTANVCIPEDLTCVDRCADVTCEDGERCNPLNGRCEQPGGMCDPCSADAECGGALDRCLGVAGPECASDADCAAQETCNATSGTCVGAFCGQDCSSGQACPEGAGCFNFEGGAQCLPIRLDCLDRCADVVCGAGFNCDDQSGECVASELAACGAPCDNNAACGEYDDLCLAVGVGTQCFYGCDDPEDPCPVGYGCFPVFTGGSFCIPNTADSSCGPCTDVVCPDGEECMPYDGSCQPVPDACTFDEDCSGGSLCNYWEGRCEPVGLPCTYEDRFAACDASVLTCDAAATGRAGTCEPICFSDAGCPLSRPNCMRYEGLSWGVCSSDSSGGAHTCGTLSEGTDGLGRACTPGADPSDPALCPGDTTTYCLDTGVAAVAPFCTLQCEDDSACGDGRCAAFDEGNFCVPAECGCLLDPEIPEGSTDLFGALLTALDTTRCAAAWPRADRRNATSDQALDDAYRLMGLGGVLGEPQQAAMFLNDEIDAMADRGDGVSALPALAISAAAHDVVLPDLSTPPDLGDTPLFTALERLQADQGGVAPTSEVATAAAALPDALEQALADIVDTFGVASDLRERAFVGHDPVTLQQVFDEGIALVAAGDTTLALDAPALQSLAANRDTQASLMAMAQELIAVIERTPRSFADVDQDTTFTFESAVGTIAIAGTGDDVHDTNYALLIELGGDDLYTAPAGANASLDAPFSIVIDLGGADAYGYVPVVDPLDGAHLPSDGAGRAAVDMDGYGPATRSTIGRQGAGRAGFGALYDWGVGADTMTSLRMSQGFGMLGVGVLVDDGGTAELALESIGQGAGLFGVGIAVLGDDSHALSASYGAQGHGAIGGIGVLVSGAAGDTFNASVGETLYAESVSQGAATGVEGASGGLGLLLDTGGNDTYTAADAAQGFARWHGAGMLRDRGGDDTYEATAWCGGAGIDFGAGSLVDDAGQDTYGVDSTPGSAFGRGENFGSGLLVDGSGADQFSAGAFSLGYGSLNGFGALFELAGDDTYTVTSNDSLGRAVLTIFGSEPSDNPRREISTWGLFVDAGGIDEYTRPNITTPVISDTATWTQRSASETTFPTYGAGADGEGVVGVVPRLE